MVSFANEDLYRSAAGPDAAEIDERTRVFWRPYHEALQGELARLHALHGRAVLWEGHSIRSHVPMLFDGRLPDLNLGTAAGTSCAVELQTKLQTILQLQLRYTHAVNGRFKGGYITRHYGAPERGVSAVQMEIAQCNYMDEDSFEYRPKRAELLQPLLREMLIAALL